MNPASCAPNTGDTNTAIESITASIPTPIMNAFLLPECLLEKPSIILANATEQ